MTAPAGTRRAEQVFAGVSRETDPIVRLDGRHVIEAISYRDERIGCTCDAVITAPPDRAAPDRHAPLVRAWEEHRLAAARAAGRRGRAT